MPVDQNPDCDVEGCGAPACWIMLADSEDADSLSCADHLNELGDSNLERARLFGPLNEIVIRQPFSNARTGKET